MGLDDGSSIGSDAIHIRVFGLYSLVVPTTSAADEQREYD